MFLCNIQIKEYITKSFVHYISLIGNNSLGNTLSMKQKLKIMPHLWDFADLSDLLVVTLPHR